jgi:hypothetical protein
LSAYAETVFNDGGVQVEVVPMSDGSTQFQATPAPSAAVAPCSDPVECNTHSP